jgi:hypothetical protein
MVSRVRQVGGDHYGEEQHGKQHWDVIARYDVGYLEATGTKYLMRHARKAGRQDVEKAVTYFEKMSELRLVTLRRVPYEALHEMYEAAGTGLVERQIITKVLHVGDPAAIREAVELCGVLIEQQYPVAR